MAKISVPDDQKQCSSDGDFDPHVASLAHWAFLISFVVPFTSLIIPLVLYNTTGKDDAFVKANAKEALNLFLFTVIMSFVFLILCLVLIGFPLLFLLVLYIIVFPIIAAIQTMSAKQGDAPYRYPVIFRILQ
jgi:uncharacterized Tic20 family protein